MKTRNTMQEYEICAVTSIQSSPESYGILTDLSAARAAAQTIKNKFPSKEIYIDVYEDKHFAKKIDINKSVQQDDYLTNRVYDKIKNSKHKDNINDSSQKDKIVMDTINWLKEDEGFQQSLDGWIDSALSKMIKHHNEQMAALEAQQKDNRF